MDSPGPWTELETSPWGQCLNLLCEALVDLDLPEIRGNVWIRDPGQIKDTKLPAIIISTSQPSHNPEEGTLTAPDLYVSAFVGFVYGSDGVSHDTFANRLLCHHAIFKQFSKRSGPFLETNLLVDFVKLMKVDVRPGDPSSPEARAKNLAAGWLEVRFHLRYPSTAN